MMPRAVGLLITAGMALIGYFIGQNVLIAPMRGSVAHQERQVQSEEKRSEVLARLTDLERQMSGFRTASLERKDASLMIDMVNRIADESGVRLTSVTPLPIDESGTYARIPIQVEMSSGFHPAGRFISRIESSPVYLQVDSLAVESPSTPGEQALRVVVTISGIFLGA